MSTGITAKRLLEWVAAVIGAANCVIIPLLFAPNQQPLFPLPGLYLVEIALIGLLVLAAVILRPSWGGRASWIAAGILLPFVLLGGFTIGFLLIPAVIAFVLVGLLSNASGGERAKQIGLLLLAAVLQGSLMLLLVLFA
jgi:hypothetical protein